MDELERKALGAADTIIVERGFPWNVNSGGAVETATDKSRLMLALAFTMGYGYGVQVMGDAAEASMTRLIEDIENA